MKLTALGRCGRHVGIVATKGGGSYPTWDALSPWLTGAFSFRLRIPAGIWQLQARPAVTSRTVRMLDLTASTILSGAGGFDYLYVSDGSQVFFSVDGMVEGEKLYMVLTEAPPHSLIRTLGHVWSQLFGGGGHEAHTDQRDNTTNRSDRYRHRRNLGILVGHLSPVAFLRIGVDDRGRRLISNRGARRYCHNRDHLRRQGRAEHPAKISARSTDRRISRPRAALHVGGHRFRTGGHHSTRVISGGAL